MRRFAAHLNVEALLPLYGKRAFVLNCPARTEGLLTYPGVMLELTMGTTEVEVRGPRPNEPSRLQSETSAHAALVDDTSHSPSEYAPQTDCRPRSTSRNSPCATALPVATPARPHCWRLPQPPQRSTMLPTPASGRGRTRAPSPTPTPSLTRSRPEAGAHRCFRAGDCNTFSHHT